ncbi:MAG: MFS transporter [Mycobacteriaceae bacterium]|nr:MFS transporter [Mycobacteriaceae bacterium]
MPLPLYLLAMAVFAMGTSEFMLAGLLPNIAAGLGVSTATAGLLTSAFAAGMVVGAPMMAGLTRRCSPRLSLLGFLTGFLASHVIGAITESFTVLFLTRIVAALANAGFLAVALSTATTLVPANKKGRALAVLLGGITVATIVGVPGGALLGTVLGWRATFWAVAALCLPAAVGVAHSIPAMRERSDASTRPNLRQELAQLQRPRLIVTLILCALINAATFGTYTFLAPLVTDVAALDSWWVSVVLALFGVGSFVGVTVAGRLSDRRPRHVIAVGGPLLLLGWVGLALMAANPVALLILSFIQGALSFALGSTVITLVLYEAIAAPTMAGSYATAALNIGAATGPVIAAATLNTTLADRGPVWASSILVAIAVLFAMAFRDTCGSNRYRGAM